MKIDNLITMTLPGGEVVSGRTTRELTNAIAAGRTPEELIALGRAFAAQAREGAQRAREKAKAKALQRTD